MSKGTNQPTTKSSKTKRPAAGRAAAARGQRRESERPKSSAVASALPRSKRAPLGSAGSPVIVSMGCPSGVGPELAVEFAAKYPDVSLVIVGDRGALAAAAEAKGLPVDFVERLPDYQGGVPHPGAQLVQVGSPLAARERRPGKPSQAGGERQLLYIEEAYRLARELALPLATLPVSKEAIAHSGLRRARGFRGHTEWLEELDGAPYSVMCFAADKLITGLVTTHLPLRQVPKAISAELVRRATLEVGRLCLVLREGVPRIAVCALNPHAGEGELLGSEEKLAILPGVKAAQKELGASCSVVGPIGAETALRKAHAGGFDAAVAMYHDQATIPMKLIDFGGTVNVTQGLSIVRTSVDHGTAYDIAGTGRAELKGFESAVHLARRLGEARKIDEGRRVGEARKVNDGRRVGEARPR